MRKIKNYLSDSLGFNDPTITWLQHRIIENYYINGPIQSLAIGTAGGREVYKICARGNHLTTVEHDNGAPKGVTLRLSRHNLSHMLDSCHVGGIEEFKTEKKFNFVIMSQVLEHIQDDIGMLNHISTLCAPHARLVISTPTSLNGQPSRSIIMEPIARGPNHVRTGYQGEELDYIAEKAGFMKIKRSYLGNPLLMAWIFTLERKALKKRLLVRLISFFTRPLLLLLSCWKCNPYVQVTVYTKLPGK